MSEYTRNCLSGNRTASEHWRTVQIDWPGVTWGSKQTTLDVPGDHTFSYKVLNAAVGQLKSSPEASVIAFYNEPFAFDPSEVTTGCTPLDTRLSALERAAKIASMTFHVASEAEVKLIRKSAIVISTGWVRVHGVESRDLISPVPVPDITIGRDGQITFRQPH